MTRRTETKRLSLLHLAEYGRGFALAVGNHNPRCGVIGVRLPVLQHGRALKGTQLDAPAVRQGHGDARLLLRDRPGDLERPGRYGDLGTAVDPRTRAGEADSSLRCVDVHPRPPE